MKNITLNLPSENNQCRKMRAPLIALALGLCVAMQCSTALAHSRWVVPSHTVVSGDQPVMVSIDFSISNDFFHPDLPLGGTPIAALGAKSKKRPEGKLDNESPMLKMLNATRANTVYPNGKISDDLPLVNLGRKSATALKLEQAGTYRVNIIQDPIDVTLFKTPEGTPSRLFGPLNSVKDKIPKGASELKTMRIYNDIHTFVTRNNITEKALAITGQGLELKHATHPNDLFAKESAKYTLLLDGKAVTQKALQQSAELTVTRQNTRYRNDRNSIKPALNSKGQFEITWPEPGLYLIEGELSSPNTAAQNGVDSTNVYAFYLTVEVMPQ